MTALGLFTPIHFWTTFPIAGLLAFAAYRMQQIVNRKQAEEVQLEEEQQIEEVRSPESVIGLLNVDPIEFEFGYGLIPLADTQQGGDLLDRIILIRRQCALELGVVVPVIRIRDNIQLRPNEYIIKIKGNIVARGDLLLGHYLAMSRASMTIRLPGSIRLSGFRSSGTLDRRTNQRTRRAFRVHGGRSAVGGRDAFNGNHQEACSRTSRTARNESTYRECQGKLPGTGGRAHPECSFLRRRSKSTGEAAA